MSASQSSNSFVLRLRGLPWNTTQSEIQKFLQGCHIRHIQFLTNEQGRDLGECFVVIDSRQDLELAKSFDKKRMSNRYIEIFDSSIEEMRHATRNYHSNDSSGYSNNDEWQEPVVRLRGLPYDATKTDIIDFFKGLQIAQNGVHISSSKPAGEAFVAFTNMDNAVRALEYNRKNMGRRYIEIFKSCFAEARSSILNDNYPAVSQTHPSTNKSYDDHVEHLYANEQLSNYYHSYHVDTDSYYSDNFNSAQLKRPLSTAFTIEMRGVPFEAGRNDIFDFFYPVVPIELEQRENPRSRVPLWYAEFGSREEATEAMTFHQKHMGKRYVELFPLYDVLNHSKAVRT